MGKKATIYLFHTLMAIATWIIAILTGLAMLAPCINPLQVPQIGVLGLLLPVLLVINLVLFIYWIIRMKWMLIIPLALLCLNYPYYGAIYQFGKQPQHFGMKTDTSNLKIATFNTLRFGGRNLITNIKEIEQYMSGENVDVICFQEYKDAWSFNNDSIRHLFKQYPFSYIGTGADGSMDLALFSRYPLNNVSYTPYPNSSRGYIAADITTPQTTIRLFTTRFESTGVNNIKREIKKMDGTDLYFDAGNLAGQLGGGLKNSYAMRGEQTDILADAVKKSPYPVIVCGDFNDTPSSYAYGTFNTLLLDGFRESGKGYGYTYNYFKKLLRIDYIFHSKELKGIAYYSQAKPWSDHNPVIMELALK